MLAMGNSADNRPTLLIGVVCNIKSNALSDEQAEFDEPETIAAIGDALQSGGFNTVILDAADDLPQQLKTTKPDIVFNIAEGLYGRGREAHVPAILEYYGIPYTGSDVVTLAVALDKALTKRILLSHGIGTPSYFVLRQNERALPDMISFPVLVKPNAEGSSKGIGDNCIAEDTDGLQKLLFETRERYDGDLLIEQYIDGREFTVGLIGNGENIRVFDPMEIVYSKPRGNYRIYSYEVKRNFRDHITYRCPPDISDVLKENMLHEADEIYHILGCRDFARIDFRIAPDERIYLIEVNPLPGLAPNYSDLPMLAAFNGIAYNDLICHVLYCALERYGMKAVEKIG